MSELLERILRQIHSPELFEILAKSPIQPICNLAFRGLSQECCHDWPRETCWLNTNTIVCAAFPGGSGYAHGTGSLGISLGRPPFQPIELAPVCPSGKLGIAAVDQNSTIATIRNTELVSDSDDVMALECACRGGHA